jgi:hypothetical protein
MRKIVLLLVSAASAMLLASATVLAQDTDTTPPETRLVDYSLPESYTTDR